MFACRYIKLPFLLVIVCGASKSGLGFSRTDTVGEASVLSGEKCIVECILNPVIDTMLWGGRFDFPPKVEVDKNVFELRLQGATQKNDQNCRPVLTRDDEQVKKCGVVVIRGEKELLLPDKAKTPIYHKKNYIGERELFGYRPLFKPNVVSFDGNNSPYIRNGTNVQHLAEEDRIWETSDFTSDIKAQFPGWNGDAKDRLEGYQIDQRIIFDEDGDAYTIAQSRILNGINAHLLLHSRDKGESWKAYKIPSRYDMPRLEFENGSNKIYRPPMIMAADGPLLVVIQPLKNKDGSLIMGRSVTIDDNSFSQGGGWASNFAVSNGDSTFIVWASRSRARGDGTSFYIARYNHLSKTISIPPQKLGGGTHKGAPDNHDIPAIAVDSQGYLHVVLGAHHGRLFYLRSLRPYDIRKWTKPEPIGVDDPKCLANCDLYTYVALQIDKKNTLHLVTRWAGNGYHFTLSYLRKKEGKQWEPRRVLVMPFRRYYGNWYQKLSQDKRGRLFLFYAYYSGQLFKEEAQAYRRKWPEDRIVAKERCVPSSFEALGKEEPRYCNYKNLRPHDPVLLMSSDGGDSWHIVTSDDF